MRKSSTKTSVRDKILNAAETLFAKRGVDGATIDEIVATAQVARGSFYYNFDSKDAVVIAIARRDFLPLAEKLTVKLAAGDSPVRLLRELLVASCKWHVTHTHLAKVLLLSSVGQVAPEAVDSQHSRSFRKLAAAILQEGQQVGEIRGDLPAEALAEIMAGIFVQAALAWSLAPSARRLKPWVDRALVIFLEGAQPRGGQT